ncbi:hypothetical protein [Methylobacterium sp. NFXW15]|uniref:hypothetical protein n=1 Tax=Methylobacterium sp. NFXW15 TaxID=2819512 RepID=UPI003CE86D6F
MDFGQSASELENHKSSRHRSARSRPIVTSGKSKHCDLQLSCDSAEGLAVVRVLLGYAGMITSSAATLVAIMAVSVIYTSDHITIGLFFFAFFNPISIIAFIGAAIIALIVSSVPFTVFIIVG